MTRQEEYEAFKQHLESFGWRCYTDHMAKDASLPYYACKRPQSIVFDCECNDKPPQLVAKLWHFYPGLYGNCGIPDSKSVELEICGQLPNNKWVWFKTSCSWDDLLNEESLKALDAMLCSAYNAAYRVALGQEK